jgi:uncharacterized membrane protein YhaH (DUF805 family)
MQLTSAGEIGAFCLARAIIVAVLMVGSPFLLSPLYMHLYQAGGLVLMTVGTLSVSFLAWLVTFVLFQAFRAGFGAVPASVAGEGRRDAVTTSAGEIGAFLIAVLIVMGVFYVLNAFVLAGVYTWLRQSGQTYMMVPMSIAIALVTAVVFFLIFIALRAAMPAVPSAGGPIQTFQAYDDGGGASMGFGRAIATCFRKYAVFSGRASRSEYWFFVLFEILLYIVLLIADIAAFRGSMNVFSTLASLVLFLPGLAVLVRRLHDADKSAWWILISFVPIIGSIWLIVLLCTPGTAGANRYGLGPAEAAIPEVFA